MHLLKQMSNEYLTIEQNLNHFCCSNHCGYLKNIHKNLRGDCKPYPHNVKLVNF